MNSGPSKHQGSKSPLAVSAQCQWNARALARGSSSSESTKEKDLHFPGELVQNGVSEPFGEVLPISRGEQVWRRNFCPGEGWEGHPRSCLRALALPEQRSNGINSAFLEPVGVQSSSGSHHMVHPSRYAQAKWEDQDAQQSPCINPSGFSSKSRPQRSQRPWQAVHQRSMCQGCANISGYRRPGTASPEQVGRAPAWTTSKQHRDRRDDASIR